MALSLSDAKLEGTFVLLGTNGSGKSSTANTLFDLDVFPVAEISVYSSLDIKHKTIQNFGIIECSGFFTKITSSYDNFLKLQRYLINTKPNEKIDAFILCVRVVENQVKFSEGYPELFFEDFSKVFNTKGLRSIIILVIQTDENMTKESIEKILHGSNGYKYLQTQIGKNVPFCLWNNARPLPDQRIELKKCIRRVEKFSIPKK